jgi:hypothetical protein
MAKLVSSIIVNESNKEKLSQNFISFFCLVNQLIGAETDVNYRIIRPVYSYEDSEFDEKSTGRSPDNSEILTVTIDFNFQLNNPQNIEYNKIVFNKLTVIENYLRNKNWSIETKEVKRYLRNILIHNKKFEAKLIYEDYSSIICFECPELINTIKVKETKAKSSFDTSSVKTKVKSSVDPSSISIIQIVDPLINDCGIFVDVSKDFSVFKYGYNYLHLFEHIITYAWRNCDKNNLKLLNGFTSLNANCLIYAVIEDYSTLISYLKSYLEFHISLLVDGFPSECLSVETNRTMSETLNEKSLTSFGRTDSIVYSKFSYEIDILKHLLQDSLKIYLVTNTEIVFDSSVKKLISDFDKALVKFNKSFKFDESKFIKSFDYIPLSVLKEKELRGIHILKDDSPIEASPYLKGKDNKIYTTQDLQSSVIIDHFMNKTCSEIKDYVNKNILVETCVELV